MQSVSETVETRELLTNLYHSDNTDVDSCNIVNYWRLDVWKTPRDTFVFYDESYNESMEYSSIAAARIEMMDYGNWLETGRYFLSE